LQQIRRLGNPNSFCCNEEGERSVVPALPPPRRTAKLRPQSRWWRRARVGRMRLLLVSTLSICTSDCMAGKFLALISFFWWGFLLSPFFHRLLLSCNRLELVWQYFDHTPLLTMIFTLLLLSPPPHHNLYEVSQRLAKLDARSMRSCFG
jgi:hypothetical protein